MVAGVGRDVRGFTLGDRVTVDPNIACGECEFCRALQPNQCLNWQGVGGFHIVVDATGVPVVIERA